MARSPCLFPPPNPRGRGKRQGTGSRADNRNGRKPSKRFDPCHAPKNVSNRKLSFDRQAKSPRPGTGAFESAGGRPWDTEPARRVDLLRKGNRPLLDLLQGGHDSAVCPVCKRVWRHAAHLRFRYRYHVGRLRRHRSRLECGHREDRAPGRAHLSRGARSEGDSAQSGAASGASAAPSIAPPSPTAPFTS